MAGNQLVGVERSSECRRIRCGARLALSRIDRGMTPRKLQEALFLATHIQAGRAQEAMLIHRIVARTIREELAGFGWVESVYADLLNDLTTFLEEEGFRWEKGSGFHADGGIRCLPERSTAIGA